MPTIIDTSVWVCMFRDTTGTIAPLITNLIGTDEVVMPQPVRFELLQGCRDAADWARMEQRVDAFQILDMTGSDWTEAAQLSFDARRAGFTIRTGIDCCIAQLALRTSCRLLHLDKDYEAIAKIRPLQLLRLPVTGARPS